eukprot:316934_1
MASMLLTESNTTNTDVDDALEEHKDDGGGKQKATNKTDDIYIFSGKLEKTTQKVLGKYLWGIRYFRLSNHSLFIFLNDKTNIVESSIELSEIQSVKVDPVNPTYFEIRIPKQSPHTQSYTIDMHSIQYFRTENEINCQKWIQFIQEQAKKNIYSGQLERRMEQTETIFWEKK